MINDEFIMINDNILRIFKHVQVLYNEKSTKNLSRKEWTKSSNKKHNISFYMYGVIHLIVTCVK